MAVYMGATKINIYGCSMNNESGSNYFFNHGKIGNTHNYQILNFFNIIRHLRKNGIIIKIICESKLNEVGCFL